MTTIINWQTHKRDVQNEARAKIKHEVIACHKFACVMNKVQSHFHLLMKRIERMQIRNANKSINANNLIQLCFRN